MRITRSPALLSVTISLFLLPVFSWAAKLDADRVIILQSAQGIEIVERESRAASVFEFGPFVAHPKRTVPGFSDPLGVGTDPMLKVFDGSVMHMDLLADFQPFNPYNPADITATPESVETDQIINEILYGVSIPGKGKLIESQLNLEESKPSRLHEQPRTTETSPLVLAGFGSISEFTNPIHLHWTHCPSYTFKRYLYKRTGEGSSAGVRRSKPRNDCFVIQ